MGKIFGIGLNKTGTRSLADAVRLLGFKALHKGDAATSALVERAEAEGMPLLTHIGPRFDAYFDVEAIIRRFQELDGQYPNSRFIMSTRSLEGWLHSREKHVRANIELAARGAYSGEWLEVDHDGWRAEWMEHHAAVTNYFAGREDMLVMDMTAGDGWNKLAPFLGRRVPSRAFPWENRDGAGTYRPDSVMKTRIRRGRLLAMRTRRRSSELLRRREDKWD